MEKITKEIALAKIERISQFSEDSECVHSAEDSLYLNFIKCIAAGLYTKKEVIELANIIKTVADIDFSRWHA